MDKNQAEDIITSAFTALIEKLRAQDAYNEESVLDDLHQLAKNLQSDSSTPLNLHSPEQSFELEYKTLAEESLVSYAQTKESVERINQEQQRVIQDSANLGSLQIDKIMQDFSSFHTQIQSQMVEANETIKDLNQKVSVLEKNSNLDPLTRTYNRRALDTCFNLLSKAKEHTPNSYILLIDIDDFKYVNDNYGHLAGDRVLMFLAKLISSSLRDGDKVFRFGGEEFLILLNRSTDTTCDSVADRILNGVRNNTLLFKEQKIKITLSMGSTKFQKFDTIESFIERADAALLKAKKSGKDQHITG